MITYVDHSGLSYDEWVFNRKDSVGSSEVGPIIIGNKWTCNLEIFYQKLGQVKPNSQSLRAWLGKETEPVSLKAWEYYDESDESISVNHSAKRKIKEAMNKKLTVFNSKFPGRTSTPDAFIQPVLKYAGRGEGFLEIKNTQSMILDSYEAGLPPDNVFQICDQLMIGEAGYGELFYFLDNRYFKGFPIEQNKDVRKVQQTIINTIGPFWENVKKAKPLFHQMHSAKNAHNYKLADEIQRQITALEPPPQNTDGYRNFLTARYKARMSEGGIIQGTDEQLQIALKFKKLSANIKKIEAEKRDLEIKIKNIMKEKTCISFGEKGRVTWYENKSGSRSLKINIK